MFYSPRVNIKYNPIDKIAIRMSAGKAFRISNVIAENIHHFASSRDIIIENNIDPEEAFNYGLNIAYCFYFLEKEGTLNFDFYNTDFKNQIVIDIENKDEILFYNLDGESYSSIVQVGLDYKIINNFALRFAYKYNNAISTFDGVEKKLPLQSKERGLINLAYNTISDKWYFDFTANYIGQARIPENIISSKRFSKPFTLFNSQITRKWKNFDVYFGGVNLSDYTQENPIIDSENPFGQNFEAALIWAPIMGRHFYIGVRYNVD